MDFGTNAFLLGLAGIKITASVDDSPSQYSILTAVRRDPMPWECLFSSDWIFWAQKTTGWEWDWSCMSHFINWTVYDYLPDQVVRELKALCRNRDGNRIRKMHQHLTEQTRSLTSAHLQVVEELMKAADGNERLFELLMKNRFGDYRPQKILPCGQLPLFEIKRQLVFEVKSAA